MLTLATGELQRELRDRVEDGAIAIEDDTGELPPTTMVSLRKLLLGGRLGMAPALMWHALKRAAVVVYLDHTAHARGWIDNVLKALVRDGRFFVQAGSFRCFPSPSKTGCSTRSTGDFVW